MHDYAVCQHVLVKGPMRSEISADKAILRSTRPSKDLLGRMFPDVYSTSMIVISTVSYHL